MEKSQQKLRDEHFIQKAKNIALEFKKSVNESIEKTEITEMYINYLRGSDFLKILLPVEQGGQNISIEAFSRICSIISGSCFSTAFLWGMHSQQTLLLNHCINNNNPNSILRENTFFIPIVAESIKHSSPSFHDFNFQISEGIMNIEIEAHNVFGLPYGDAFLITIPRNLTKSKPFVFLVKREQLKDGLKFNNDPLGIAGIQKGSLNLSVEILTNQILDYDIELKTGMETSLYMLEHIVFSSCTLGIVKSAFLGSVEILSSRPHQYQSEFFLGKIARLRLKIDLIESYLKNYINLYGNLSKFLNEKGENYIESALTVKSNSLKLIASELLSECIDELIDLLGLEFGYLKNDKVYLDKYYKEMLSIKLLVNKQNISVENGILTIAEYQNTKDIRFQEELIWQV